MVTFLEIIGTVWVEKVEWVSMREVHSEVPWEILLSITVSTFKLIPGDVIYLANKVIIS